VCGSFKVLDLLQIFADFMKYQYVVVSWNNVVGSSGSSGWSGDEIPVEMNIFCTHPD
jgi:hypothetical protein